MADRLNKVRLRVDPLVSEGVFFGALAALSSVDAHYNGFNFEAVGQGYPPNRSAIEIGVINNTVTLSAQAFANQVAPTDVASSHKHPKSKGIFIVLFRFL